jgi:gliding motility-associated-like protein
MPPEVISVTEVPPTCPETCDGSLTIEVEPNPNFQIVRYLIQRPGPALDTFTNSTTLTVDGFCSGQFYSILEIEDEAGCIYQPGILSSFPERDSLEVDSIILTDPSCNSFSDGSIEVRLIGGEMPYIYSWDDGRIDTLNGPGIRTDLADGSYTVTVNDINDCGSVELSFELEEPEPLNVDFDNIMDASCFNTCDGSAQATGSGGPTDPSGYTFTWSSGFSTSGNPTSVANDLCPDEAFIVLSSDICTDTFSVNIPAPDAITNQVADSVPPSCFGDSDGSIEVAASGGNGNFTYQWQGGPQNARYSDLTAGTYIVEITDALNCTLIDTIALNEPDSLIAFFEPDNILNPSCPGELDGMLTVSVTGGNGPGFIYDWQDDISQNEEAVGLDVGRYEVTVSDVNGCSDTTSATLFTNPPISFILPQPDTPACNGETVLYQIDSISGGSGGPYQYQVPGLGFVDQGQAVPVSEGSQSLTIIDGNGCSVDTFIDVPTREAISITLAPNQEIRLGESLQLFPVISGPFPIVGYQWSPEEGLSCNDCPNPEVTPGGNTTYTLIVTDANGCTAAAVTNVRTNAQRDIYIPNVFSPNGDEINDVFQVFSGPGVDRLNSFQIFDRWGVLMWEGRNLLSSGEGSPGWNGRRNGQSAPAGVYAYKIEILFIDGRIITYRGDVTLVR